MANDVARFLDAGYRPIPSKICKGIAYPFETYGCTECERIEELIPFKLDNGWAPTYVCNHCGHRLIKGKLKEAMVRAQVPRTAMIQEIVLNKDSCKDVDQQPLWNPVFTYKSKGKTRSFRVRCPTCWQAPLLRVSAGCAD